MGSTNKLTASVAGVPMVARVVDALLQSHAEPVLVVTGHEPERIADALTGREVRLVHNADYADGIASSIRVGIEALGDGVDGAVIALADMPWVGTGVIDKLIDAYTADGDLSIFVPMFGRKRGNPVLWGAQHFPELTALSGDVGGQSLFHRYSAAIRHVDVDSANINIDVDTPEALQDLGIVGEGEENR